MKLSDLFGKKHVADEIQKPVPYMVLTEFSPYKLFANRRSSSMLSVKLRNLTKEPLMTSIVVELPNNLSFDQTGITKQREIRLGDVAPNELKESKVDIFSDVGTDKGEYTIGITAFAHYRDYGHVLNAIKKKTELEVV